MTRFLTTCLFLSISLFAYAQSKDKGSAESWSTHNRLLSPQQMKGDLQVFYEIRKKVNSGLYIYRTDNQIDSIYNWAFEKVKQPLHFTDFFKIILQLTDFEGSVHNYTEPGSDFMEFLKGQKAYFPYHLAYIEGKMIFDGHHSTIPPGARIISINGVQDTALMQSFEKYFPVDGHNTTYKRRSSVEKIFEWRYFIEYGLPAEYLIEYSDPGSDNLKKISLPAVTFEQYEENLANKYSAAVSDLLDFKKQPEYSFEMIQPNTGLLNLRCFCMASGIDDPAFETYVSFVDSVFQVLDQNKIPNLIIDVRNNPGGSDPTFEQPIMYLSDKNFKENLDAHIIFDPSEIPYEEHFWGVSTSERIDSLTLAKGREFLKDYFYEFKDGKSLQNDKYNPVYKPKTPAYKGKLYLLINENVASAASHFASLVKAYARNVTIVGVETVGGYYDHNGHISLIYELPTSGIKTKFSVVYVVQGAPRMADQPDGRGIIPDKEVWPSLQDFLNHKDTQMEAILD
ncbi:S41 family peptidase [Algoriphagus sp.]|uniref:S41 family peptidase n=1 Tax=Algoriphagus sp. TaxID=1872435 RepID=UPI003F6EA696